MVESRPAAQVTTKDEDTLLNLANSVLGHLNNVNEIPDSSTLTTILSADPQNIEKVLKSLMSEDYIELSVVDRKILELSEEAQQYVKNGTPEVIYASALQVGVPTNKKEADAKIGDAVSKIGFAKAMQQKWIKLEGENVTRVQENLVDNDRIQLQEIQENPDPALYEGDKKKVIDLLKKRKLVSLATKKSYKVTKGKNFAPIRQKLETDLTAEMIKTGEWKSKNFKNFNFNAQGIAHEGGHLHPLLKVRAMFREILLEMGFNEMPTDKFVESSFWNFDTLFQPQSHPARDMHDTFFLKNPSHSEDIPAEYCEAVKDVHEKGGFGSVGYQYKWDIKEAKKNLLRTHTTAVSSRMLFQLAQKYKETGVFQPMKYFSIDRVYRNENLDATHLAEFHQIEGFIADRNIGLSHLLGILAEFYAKIGITQLKYKPAYNPYTEPSLEIFGYHPQLKKWVEIGNSGVFRPEMLRPMGLPEDVSVIAWGLSLERPTMIYYGISNIRDLFGHKVSLASTKQNKICYINP